MTGDGGEIADLTGATVRELVVELARAEDAVRLAAATGDRTTEMVCAVFEQAIVDELRSREVMVSLGPGAEAAVTAGERPDGEDGEEPDPDEVGDQRTIADLERAVVTRTTIGRATGILMERHQLDASEAFERLRVTSQQRNIKVRDVAAELVASGVEKEEWRIERKLSDRASVARAQGVLMERHHLTEAAALDWLTAAAERTHRPVWTVAEDVVSTGADPDSGPGEESEGLRDPAPDAGSTPGPVGSTPGNIE